MVGYCREGEWKDKPARLTKVCHSSLSISPGEQWSRFQGRLDRAQSCIVLQTDDQRQEAVLGWASHFFIFSAPVP